MILLILIVSVFLKRNHIGNKGQSHVFTLFLITLF